MVQHTVDTGDHPPIKQRPYRVPAAVRETFEQQLAQMQKQGVIKRSSSAWASPILFVGKKEGTLRFCIDLRKVNAVTKKDSFPLPLIDEILDHLGNSLYFTTLDMTSGYWQVKMAPASQEKTAFICPEGLFEFTVMPFGLCNGPASFQRLMQMVLSGLTWQKCLVYLDDIMVYSSSFDQHLKDLEAVFLWLTQHNLCLKIKKCHFARTSVPYLGHIVSSEGIAPDPDKIRAVQDFPVPTEEKHIRQFLGLCSYYRRFVKDFVGIANPLTELTKSTVPFVWTPRCQEAFGALKKRLLEAPILAYPDFKRTFVLYTDASGIGLGAVLTQKADDGKERAIAYISRHLKPAEKNYSTIEQEALAIV